MNILITGATSGIGFLTGISLADRGHKVFMTTHTEKQLKTLNNKIKNINIEVETFKLDITDSSDILKLKNLDIDILINHAGIGIGGSIIDLDIEELRKNFDVNFFSSFNLVKIVANKIIKEGKKGRIIITSSIAGTIPIEFLGSYCSTKSAITMMAKCLNKELKLVGSNINVIIIEPGVYDTGFNQRMIDSIEKSINRDSIFLSIKNKIHKKLSSEFKFIEHKKYNSIVVQIIKAVEEKNPKLVYKAPLSQSIMSRLYRIFSK